MSTIKRRKRSSRIELGPYRSHELLTGQILYPALGYDGNGDGQGTDLEDFISDEMKRDWRSNRDELLAFWKTGEYTTEDIFPGSLPWLFIRGYPGTLPWGARFDKDGGDPKDRGRVVKEVRPIA